MLQKIDQTFGSVSIVLFPVEVGLSFFLFGGMGLVMKILGGILFPLFFKILVAIDAHLKKMLFHLLVLQILAQQRLRRHISALELPPQKFYFVVDRDENSILSL